MESRLRYCELRRRCGGGFAPGERVGAFLWFPRLFAGRVPRGRCWPSSEAGNPAETCHAVDPQRGRLAAPVADIFPLGPPPARLRRANGGSNSALYENQGFSFQSASRGAGTGSGPSSNPSAPDRTSGERGVSRGANGQNGSNWSLEMFNGALSKLA